MESTSFSYGFHPGQLRVVSWSTTPGWVRFADGKRRLVRPGDVFVTSYDETEDSYLLIERISLH